MNLVEGLHEEMDRVRGIIKIYDGLPNNAGALASGMMKHSIKNSEKLIATGDTVEMLKAYNDLKMFKE